VRDTRIMTFGVTWEHAGFGVATPARVAKHLRHMPAHMVDEFIAIYRDQNPEPEAIARLGLRPESRTRRLAGRLPAWAASAAPAGHTMKGTAWLSGHCDQPSAPIDTAGGTSYIVRGAHVPVPPSSDQLRVPMFWVHLKVPHRRLPRA
jgi:hypothetical protein